MGSKKGSVGAILMHDLNELRRDREVLIEEGIKTLSEYNPEDKETKFILETIAKYNLVIAELEHIVEKAKKARGFN